MHNLSDNMKGLDQWLAALEVAAVGNYVQASSMLFPHCPLTPCNFSHGREHSKILTSLCFSTYASWMRQLGRHDIAVSYDSQALRVLGWNPAVPISTEKVLASVYPCFCLEVDAHACGREAMWLVIVAYVDALTGLVADNLGLGLYEHSRYMVQRLYDLFHSETLTQWYPSILGSAVAGSKENDGWLGQIRYRKETLSSTSEYIFSYHRLIMRWLWVSCEYSLYTGLADAQEKAQLLTDSLVMCSHIPFRHEAKSRIIAHAAGIPSSPTIAGDLEHKQLYPLLWAWHLLTGDHDHAHIVYRHFHVPRWLGLH